MTEENRMRGAEGEARTVRSVMSAEVTTLDVNDTLAIADDVMNLGRIRHMPVLDGDGLIAGIVSQRDLFRGALAKTLGYGQHAQQKLLDILYVKDVMSNDPITIGPDELLSEAAKLLFEAKVGCLLVVESEKLIGILTEGDFVRLAIADSE